jgi:hypothetical protein
MGLAKGIPMAPLTLILRVLPTYFGVIQHDTLKLSLLEFG